MKRLGHVITAMVTPFGSDGHVDYDEAIRLGNYLFDHGTDTILLSGTTGESPTLKHVEEFELYRRFVEEFKGKHHIMAGTGSNCTRTAIESTKEAETIGVDSVLQVVPYYNKPSQEGLYQHFKAVAENTGLPIIIYNIPGRTSKNLEPDTIARLSKIKNIIGIKEAAGSVEQVKKIKSKVDRDFLIYSGDDGLILDFMEEGACGVVSVASHCAGNKIHSMINHMLKNEVEKARAIEETLKPLFETLFMTSNPTPVKKALEFMGFNVGIPRLPLVAATPEESVTIRAVLKELNII